MKRAVRVGSEAFPAHGLAHIHFLRVYGRIAGKREGRGARGEGRGERGGRSGERAAESGQDLKKLAIPTRAFA